MVILVLIAVFFAGAFFFTSISKQNDRRRRASYNRSRRSHSRRRGRYDDDDDYYDDRDDDYRRNRRGGHNRRDEFYDDELDFTGIFISFGILVLIGMGIYYWYNQPKRSNELIKSKIVMMRDAPNSTADQNNEQKDLSEDGFPVNNNNLKNEDLDEDVGYIEENIPEDYDEQDATVEIPLEIVPGNFYAQVHAFGNLDNASVAKEDWLAKGYLAKVVYFKNGDGLYHVLIGGYPSRRAAKSFMGKAYEQIYELEEGQYYDLK